MRNRLSLSVVSSLAALLLVAPAASASSEAGWNCTATGSKPGVTLLATPWPDYPVSPLVKEFPGVIVGFALRVGPGLGPIAQQLGVFRPSSAGQYTKVAESAVEVFPDGFTQYPARIPVQRGDFLGLYGPVATLYCGEGPGALFEGAIAVGETKPFVNEDAAKSPVSAVVEPDLDGDGYGDQSQDGCPISPMIQTDCPIPALTVGKVSVKKRAILIEASNNTEASFQAIADVRWRKKPKGPTVIVGFRSQGPTHAAGGIPVQLRLPLPKAVRERLAKLPPRRFLRARIDVRATNLVPYVGTKEIKVKLPGRKTF